jgi:acyl-CoA reductase-like NAD-dependent aldehyde dehydrogenase
MSVVVESWNEVRSPYSGELVGRVPLVGADEARSAVAAAAQAMEDPLPPHERAAILERVSAALIDRHEEVARVLSSEAGKPIKAARIEAERAAGTYAMAAAVARSLVGEMVPLDGWPAGSGKLGFTIRVPVGVVGAITPFNFPLNLAAHKLAPALAAGCVVVLKPARQTPLTALLLAELEAEAGLPAGWLNVIVGPAEELGDVLVEDERVALISFTGSGEVGWKLRERAPRKRVLLELGGSAPVLVEPDADLDDAAAKITAGAFGYAGQSCISVQRVYVRREVFEQFVARLLPRVEALRVGDPADDETDVGPVINANERARVLEWIEEARAGGAVVLTGGEARDGVILPTVLAAVTPEMRVCRCEVFGPVCSLIPYSSLEEGLALANGTDYGLQAGIFTRDLTAALTAARTLRFGGVTVNEAPTFRTDQMPYGGVKASGNTKEGPAYVVRELTEERLVIL